MEEEAEQVKNDGETSEMFNFIKTMWFMRKATEFFVEEQARRGRISDDEKNLILSTLQIPEVTSIRETNNKKKE